MAQAEEAERRIKNTNENQIGELRCNKKTNASLISPLSQISLIRFLQNPISLDI